MKDEAIRDWLKPVYEEAERDEVPPFGQVWASASKASEKSRRRIRVTASIAAAVAVMAITVALWPLQQAETGDEYLIAEALLNSTAWSAPSDALMPQHQFDIYREIPFPAVSTDRYEGALL